MSFTIDTQLNTIIQLSITTISFSLQSSVLWMIWRISPPEMSTYRYFLSLIAIWDLAFNVLLGFGMAPEALIPRFAMSVHGFFGLFGFTGSHIGVHKFC